MTLSHLRSSFLENVPHMCIGMIDLPLYRFHHLNKGWDYMHQGLKLVNK